MEKKYLIENLKRLAELSPDELEQRDLYLRDLHTGAVQGPLTGSLYLDRPYTAWYKGSGTSLNPNETIYTNFVSSVVGRENEIAVTQTDNGKVLTYGELLAEVDKAAAGLAKEGIKEGSMVGMFFSNSIEEAIFLLALNKLGATSKWIDYTKDKESLFLSITEAKLDMLIIEDMLKPLEAAINPIGVRCVVCGNTTPLAPHQITYEDLKEEGRDTAVEAVPYKDDNVAVIISSSGTTGDPKPIAHSNKSMNNAAIKMMHSNFDLDSNHIVMQTIPPHIGLGLITTLYTNLISGAKLAMIHCNGPEDSMHKTVGFLLNYKDAVRQLYQDENLRLIIFGAPIHVRIISSVEQLKDLSFLDGFLAAGSKISAEELIQFENIFREKGCTCPISNGYGQNEMGGAVAINDPVYNLNGAAGYPVIGSNILIVDEKTHEILPPTEEGLILERCNTQFMYYLNMPEETAESVIDIEGMKYFDTHDIGRFDDNGFLYITGRTSRVLVKFDTKISLDKIEAKVRMLPFVKECATLVDGAGGSFERLLMFVEPSEEYAHLSTEDVLRMIEEAGILSDTEKPDEFVLRTVPYMNNGKIDFQKIKAEHYGQTRMLKKGD